MGDSKPRVVVADKLGQSGLALLRESVEVVEATDPAALPEALPLAEALIVRSRTRVTAGVMDRARRLQLVARAGIGVDNIDLPAASERGVLVINAPAGSVVSTAEHTIALIFALARKVVAADTAVREGQWNRQYEGMQLAGKRLGVIGMGKVGTRVASLAGAIGMHVVACDPYLPTEAWFGLPARRIEASDLLQTSDVVTVHVSLSEETRNLMGRDEFAAMKRGAYFVNCARGALVDEAALARALQEGHLAGAALDVFAQEPLQDSPLLHAPNVILTPHVAASTREAQEQIATDIAVQVVDFFAGRSVAYPVNPSVLRKD
jgi:D-3-phosphoglycerate dehydrogenase